jgi:ATPase family associated with various cellular activities (AAA)
MIPGGISSKLGNTYEAKWLALCFLYLLGGECDSLRYEGITTEYQGFECSVHRGETVEWHQTKINAPSGQWTIGRLGSEGVLKAFANRLAAAPNAKCIFVSQDPARDLKSLSEKARVANDLNEFLKALPGGLEQPFDSLVSKWATTRKFAFEWLQRCEVQTLPETQLDSLLRTYGQFSLYSESSSLFPILRNILEANFNKNIDVVHAKALIGQNKNVQLKSWLLPGTTKEVIATETDSYLSTYIPFGAGGQTIERSVSTDCIKHLLDDDECNLLLVTGAAGSGKSGVVRAVINELRLRKVTCLAIRIDQYLDCHSPTEVGQRALGRQESPAITLHGVSRPRPAVLIIDQVDAVSEVSGREGKVKETVFQLIDQCKTFGNVKCMVVCRAFDLETDHRLRALKTLLQCKQVEVLPFDWTNEVEPMLVSRGISVANATPSQKALLCSPINLSVFLESEVDGLNFKTRNFLYDHLLAKKERYLKKYGQLNWALFEPLAALGKWMSDKQSLTAPVSILDRFSRAKEILISEGFVVFSAKNKQLNFFHESFFDYVYSRDFLTNGQSVAALLATTEQHLFRRTQTRQILDALRQNDFPSYLQNLEELLGSPTIRYHIKLAICQWLNTVTAPTAEEFTIVSMYDIPTAPFSQLFRSAVLVTESWFDLLLSGDWIDRELSGGIEQRVNTVLWWLSNNAGGRPAEIASVLRKWWNSEPAKADRLLDWFGYIRQQKASKELLAFCEDVIRAKPPNLFENTSGRDRLMMLFHSWSEKEDAELGQLLRVLFEAWFEIHPGQIPFERDEFRQLDPHSLQQIAKKSPLSFLNGVTDAFTKSIRVVVDEGESGSNWYYVGVHEPREHMGGFDLFLSLYRDALCSVAVSEPDQAVGILRKLNAGLHECLMHLHLEAIAANPTALGRHLIELLSCNTLLEAGFEGIEWMSFSKACNAALPFLSNDERQSVFKIVLSQRPEIARASNYIRKSTEAQGEDLKMYRQWTMDCLSRSGFRQWCMLSVIGKDFLSVELQKLASELDIKFSWQKLPEPHSIQGGWVASPIKRERCQFMSDSQWLAAFERYCDDDERRRGRGFVDGGARQLAMELRELVKKSPVRFARLALKIPADANVAYLEQIISGLSESELDDYHVTTNVLLKAHGQDPKAFGDAIVRVIAKHTELARSPELFSILIEYSQRGAANESADYDSGQTQRETVTAENLLNRLGGLYLRGINGTRGSAWEAIASVLWVIPELRDEILLHLESCVRQEKLVSVRCCMARTLGPLFNHDKARFEEAVLALVEPTEGVIDLSARDAALSPLITHYGIHLFPYISHHLPDLFLKLTEMLRGSGNRDMQLIGAWLVFRAACVDSRYFLLSDSLSNSSKEHRKLHADVLAQAIAFSDRRTLVIEQIVQYFSDPDDEVQAEAADAFRNMKPSEVLEFMDLARAFVKSPAYVSNGWGFLHMLETAECDVLDLVIEATDTAVKSIKSDRSENGSKYRDFHQIQDLLKREYNSSEARPDARRKILDTIDLMLSAEVHGAAEIVSAHER